MIKRYKSKRIRRGVRTRGKLTRTRTRPRLVVTRSNKYLYTQLVDQVSGKTLFSVRGEKPAETGEQTGKKALKLGIKKVIFDRGPNKFHGRIKSLAEAARKEGLEF